ncbi:ABC transporter substrate-binding protein [Acetobacter vaccinii]|nr:ABC transporter substrate-binding protein [Acetobacter vaccinii]
MGATKQLRIGVHYEPSNVDPHLGAAELALQMTNGVFDTLVNKTADGAYLPGLAETFSISDDHLRYTFHLRKDVVFHDGTPFTAHAMKISLDRARDPQNKSQLAGGLLGSYRESRAVDEHCLEIILDSPYALLLDALSQGWLAPVAPTCATSAGSTFITHPVGTGPFRFVRWNKGDCLIIRRNEAYAWAPPVVDNAGPPLVDEILFKFLPDDNARTAALLDGSVDMILAANPADAQTLRATAGLAVTTWPIRGVPVSLMMNIKRSPTSSLAVRQAISHALDVDALVQEVFRGEFTRAYGPVSQFTLGYEPGVENMYPHSPTKAATLLEQEGWMPGPDGIRERDGEALRVTFYALPVNFYPQFGAIVARQLALVGIAVDVELCSPPQWIQAGMQGLHNLIPQGKYASSSQLLGFVYHSRKSGPGSYGWSKRGPQDYPTIDTQIDAAETCLTPAEFVPHFATVQMDIMRAALAVPLHCNATLVAARDTIGGLRFDAIGAYPLFHDITFQQDEA